MTKLMHPDSDLEVDVNPGSAPRYYQQGWREIAADAPKGNDSLSEWQEYALSKGFSDDEIDGQSRDQLRATLA